MNITVLGAGGFIGSHMVEQLAKRQDHSITGLDVSDEKLADVSLDGVEFEKVDITAEPEVLENAIREADLVVDLVAYANPSLYVSSPLEVFDLNFTQNLLVANMCIKHGKRLIQYSSAEVYGKCVEGDAYYEDESDSVFGPTEKQRWIYAAAKALLERVLYAHGVEGDLEYTIVRPFNFLGSRIDYLVPPGTMGGPRVFAHFMSALLNDGPMYLVDGGTVHRTFLHIEDATEAFLTIIDNPEKSRNQIINVGNPDSNVTIIKLAELMIEIYEELTGKRPATELLTIDGEEFYGKGYEDSDRLPPDISKMRALGWTPKRDLRSTLRDTMEYYISEPRQTKEPRLVG